MDKPQTVPQESILPNSVQELPTEARALWLEAYSAAVANLECDEMAAWGLAWHRVRDAWQLSGGQWTRKAQRGPAADDVAPEMVRLAMPLPEYLLEDGAAGAAPEFAPMEICKTGTWVASFGEEITLTREMFDGIVANFEDGLLGRQVPVISEHTWGQRGGEAFGWVKSLWRQEDVLMAQPDWNALGREAISDRRFKYNSIGVNLESRILYEASLTNFPAVKGLKEISLSELRGDARAAYFFAGPASAVEVIVPPPDSPTGESRVGGLTGGDGGYRRPVRVAAEGAHIHKSDAVESQGVRTMGRLDVSNYPIPEGGLSEQDRAQLAAHFGITTAPAKPAAEKPAPDALSAGLGETIGAILRDKQGNMEAALEEVKGAIAQDARRLLESFEEERRRAVEAQMREFREERAVAQFSERATQDGRYVLPGTAGALKDLLLEVPQPTRGKVVEYLKGIHDRGLVDMSELGSERGVQKVALPADAAKALRQFLSGKSDNTVALFFRANGKYLGAADKYDLSEFAQ